MILVDADVWIDFLAGHGPGAGAVEALLLERRAAISLITVYELFCGATRPGQVEQLETLVEVLAPIPLTYAAVRLAAAEYVRLRRRGEMVSNEDLLVGVAALELGFPVLTRNRSHFERIEGLEVLTPPDVASGSSG